MVGFNHIVIFNNNGKITDFQKAYNKESQKTLSVFLPLNFNNKKRYKAVLSIAVNNTYPKRIETVEGFKSEADLNKYVFDITQMFALNANKKFGLCRVKLVDDNNRTQFESESFRLQ